MPDDELGARLSLKDRREFTRDTERAARDVRKIGDAADHAQRQSSRAFSLIGGGLKSLGGLVVRGGAVIGGVVAAAGGALVALGVKSLAAYEQAEIGFTTMLGSGDKAKAFLSSLEGFAAKTPFELPGLITASQQLLAFGFGAQEIIPMMTKIGDAAAGLGAGQEGIDRITRSLGQMRAKGRVQAEEMMQLAELGIPAWDMLAKKLGTDIPTAMDKVSKKQVDAATGIDAILTGMSSRFGGLMEKQATTIGGLWSTLKDTVTISARKIVTPFQKDITNALTGAINLVQKFADTAIERIPGIVDAFKLGIALKPWTEGMSDLEQRFYRVGTALNYIKQGDLMSFATSLGAAIAPGVNLRPVLNEISSVLSDVWTIMRDGVIPAFQDVSSVLPLAVTPLALVRDILHAMAKNAKTLRPLLVSLIAIYTAYKVISWAIVAVDKVRAALEWLEVVRLHKMKDATMAQRVAMLAVRAATLAWAAAQWILNAAFTPLGFVIIIFALLAVAIVVLYRRSETFRNIVSAAFGFVLNVIKSVWNWVKTNWPLLLAILMGPIALAVLAIVKNWDSIKAGASAAFDWIRGVVSGFIDFFTTLPGKIASAASGLFDGIKNAFRSAINWVIRAWNSLEFKIPGFDPPGPGPKFGGFTLGVPDIPTLHAGGRVSRDGAVNVRPDEEIITLPRGASVVPLPVGTVPGQLSGAEGDGKPIVLQVVLEKKVLAEAVYDHTRDEVARR